MSHIIKLEIRITRPELLAEIATQRGIPVTRNTTVNIYQTRVSGMALSLPGWRYPVVVDNQGVLHYDNYEGNWGDIKTLNTLVQSYVAGVVAQEAFCAGKTVFQNTLDDGTIVLRVTM